MSLLRVGVFGCGHLGRIHTRLARQHQQAELVGVYDPFAAAAESVAREFQVPQLPTAEALAERIDCAIVATPTLHHHAVAAPLLARGISCFVEKPMTTTLDQADDLIRLAAARGLTLQVGHVERFNPAWLAARPLLKTPRYVEATRASGYTYRSTDVGVVLDLMIHDLDLTLSLLPCPLVSVEAWGQVVMGPHEDVAQATLRFADGAVAQLSASRVSPEARRAMRVYCDDLHASVDFASAAVKIARLPDLTAGGASDPAALSAEEKAARRERFFQEVMPVEAVEATPRNAIELEQRDFFEAIASGRTPQVSGGDGRRTLEVAQAIVERIHGHRSDRDSQVSFPFPVVAAGTSGGETHRARDGRRKAS